MVGYLGIRQWQFVYRHLEHYNNIEGKSELDKSSKRD